jgi:hypothetical protein
MALAFDIALKQISAVEAKAADLQTRLDLAAKGGIAPVPQAPRDADADLAKSGSTDPAGEFDAKVNELVKTGKSRSEAMIAVAHEHPELHKAWLTKVNSGRR